MRKRIIFYKLEASVADLEGEQLTDSALERFDSGELNSLLVREHHITGWQTAVSRKEVDILFMDSGWAKEELAQANERGSK